MNKIFMCLAMFLLMGCGLSAENAAQKTAEQPPAENVSKDPVLKFKFIVQPKRTRALIEWIKIFDGDGREVGVLAMGKDDDRGPSRISLLEEDHWGDLNVMNGVTARYVNGKDVAGENSGFYMAVKGYKKGDPLTMKVRYLDVGEDLMPIEVDYGDGFRRVGQILFENTNQWMEDEFDLP